MMNNLMVFEYKNNAVRTVMVDGDPWWVAKDVCDVLVIGNPSMALRRLDGDEKTTLSLTDGGGRPYKLSIINEPGLYSLILSSRKPEAKAFKRWVTHEVLPSLRKTGQYSITNRQDSYMIEDPVERAKQWIKEEEERQRLAGEVERLKPDADLGSKVINGKAVYKLADFGKTIGLTRNIFFRMLRADGILLQNEAVPYSYYLKQGYFEVREVLRNGKIFPVTLVTGKGQEWLNKRYGKITATAALTR